MPESKEVLGVKASIPEVHDNNEWARIPPIGKTLEGFYRTELFKLVKENKIKSAAFKPKGSIKTGIRLVHIPSLREYIAKHSTATCE